jgi:D-3-phosphoglycerate dehydrogenase
MHVLHVDENHPLLLDNLAQAGFKNTLAYKDSKEEILKRIDQFEGIIIRSRFPLDAAGVENIDLAKAEEKGIQLFAAPLGNSNAVGEHALGMLLSLFNKLQLSNQSIRQGNWLREEHRGLELEGKTIGIIGYGTMGKSFAKKLLGFAVKQVIYYDILPMEEDGIATQVSLEEVQATADVLSLHTPQTPLTVGMIDTKFINQMKHNFWLLNTARGSAVVTDALVAGLKNNKVLGAGLDVLEYESSSFENIFKAQKDNPSFSYLLGSEKVILSPHVAGWTVESHSKLAQIISEKICSAFGTTLKNKS